MFLLYSCSVEISSTKQLKFAVPASVGDAGRKAETVPEVDTLFECPNPAGQLKLIEN